MPEDSPEIPNLKNAPPQGSSLPNNVALVGASARPAAGTSPVARLKKFAATPAGKIAAFALMMAAGFGLGLGLLAVTALEFDDAKPRAPGLAGLKSSLRVRPALAQRLRYLSSKPGDLLDLIRGTRGEAGRSDDAGELAAQEGEYAPGDLALEVDIGPAAGGNSGDGGGVDGGARPTAGSLDFPFPKGSPPRGNDPPRGAPPRAQSGIVAPRGAPARLDRRKVDRSAVGRSSARRATTAAAAAPPENRRSSLDFVKGNAGAVKAAAIKAAAAAADKGGSGASSAPRGSGANAVPEDIDPQESLEEKFSRLSRQAADHGKKAAEEKKRAQILAAGGHMPAAHYHYDKSEKEKKKADAATAEMHAISTALAEQITKEADSSE